MRRGARGFTLVEALVALVLFALMAVVAYRGLSALLDGRRHLTAEAARWQGLDRAFGLLRSDLEAGVDRPVRNNFGVEEPAFSADFDAGAAQDAAVWWTRTGAPGSSDEPAAPQRIGWRLREHRLERLRWPAPDRGPRSEPEVLAVLDGVSALTLRYLALTPSGPAWDTRWQRPAHLSLPRAVEVSVDLQDGRHLVRTFALPAAP